MNDSRKVWSVLALGVAAVAPFGAACGGSNPPSNTAANGSVTLTQPPPGYQGAPPPGYPQQQPPPPGYPQQQGYPQQGYPQQPQAGYPPPGQPQPAPGQPPPAGAAPPPGPLAPTDPASLQGILAGLQAAVPGQLAMPGAAAAIDPVEAGLKLLAAKDAPGMQPEGQELKQTLNEGQHTVMMLTLQAGKCYAIVGFSPPGAVKDLDLNLLAPPFYATLAGQDLTHNNTPGIGAAPSPMCPIVPFPVQYKLDVFARVGSGPIAVQLYSKNK